MYQHRRRLEPRALECATTIMMLGIAVCIFLTPRTIELGSFRYLLESGLTPQRLTLLFFVGGILRAVALVLNGRWRWGPVPRAIGAAIGCVLWMHFAAALWLLTAETGTLSPGIPVYAVLAGGEFVCAYRVMKYLDLSPASSPRRGADVPRTSA